MRRIALWVMSTVSGVVLLFSYHTSTDSGGATTAAGGETAGGGTSSSEPAPSSSPGSTSAPTGSSKASSGSAASSSPKATSSSSKASSGTHTYTGASADTRWGPVQVRITVKDGTIIKSEAVVFPQDNPRDQEINSYAVPTLDQEVLAQQSASIDAVSGATVTSGGYLQSLQSAIDEAHL